MRPSAGIAECQQAQPDVTICTLCKPLICALAGDWGIGDDRRLLKALFRGGFSTEWQVDWGALVPQRTAVAARRRWRLMLKSVPDHLEKSLCDIIDELVSTHIPFLKDKAGRVSNDL